MHGRSSPDFAPSARLLYQLSGIIALSQLDIFVDVNEFLRGLKAENHEKIVSTFQG